MRDEYIAKQRSRNLPDTPNFSPFPQPKNPGSDVPLSDEEEGELLERMRPTILSSSDPELQLGWAQDALAWVEVSSNYATRQQEDGQGARSITPKLDRELRNDAKSIVEFLGEQHHPKAEFLMGMWMEFGKFGYRVDKKEAFLNYRRAAEKQYARAEYRIGMQYEGSNNPTKAVEHYKKGVELKDSASNYRYGMMTLLGQHGVSKDFRKGIELIKYAACGADKNAPQGAYVYGMLLARELPNIDVPDEYLPFDLNEARTFVERAAKFGFAKAQLKMAQAFELCQLGCEFDPVLSLHYNALASKQGEAEADMAISKWFLCGYENLFQKNEELAFTYAKRAASTQMPTAEFALGYFYEIGIHVTRDLQKSEHWYKLAAEHGNKDAFARIESFKQNSTLTKNDHEKVAINRIKSQYGSMRGKRPDRLKEKVYPMASMSEEHEMPDPTKSHSQVGQQPLPSRQPTIPQVSLPPTRESFSVSHSLPPRSASAAPYPEDDGPPKFNIAPPKKSAPYPVDDTKLLGVRLGPHADRPSSAFGIRPLVSTEAFGPVNGRGEQRPATSMANMQPGGRGQVAPNRGGFESKLPAQYLNTNSQPNTRPNSQLPLQAVNRPSSQPPPEQVVAQRPGRLDSLPSQRNRLDSLPSQQGRLPTPSRVETDSSTPGNSSGRTGTPADVNKPHPPQPSQEGVRYPPDYMQRPSSPGGPAPAPGAPHPPIPQGQGRFDDLADHNRTSSAGYGKVQSAANSWDDQNDGKPTTNASSGRKPLPSNTMSSQSSASTVAGKSSASTPAQPQSSTGPPNKPTGPRKGPETFEAMGIPSAQKESDCVSFHNIL